MLNPNLRLVFQIGRSFCVFFFSTLRPHSCFRSKVPLKITFFFDTSVNLIQYAHFSFSFIFFNKKNKNPFLLLSYSVSVRPVIQHILFPVVGPVVLMVNAVIISHKFTELKKSISILVHGIKQQIYKGEE